MRETAERLSALGVNIDMTSLDNIDDLEFLVVKSDLRMSDERRDFE